jgi:GNAT superfamily N-acetyltransferase
METLIRLYLASLYLLPDFQRKGIGGIPTQKLSGNFSLLPPV